MRKSKTLSNPIIKIFIVSMSITILFLISFFTVRNFIPERCVIPHDFVWFSFYKITGSYCHYGHLAILSFLYYCSTIICSLVLPILNIKGKKFRLPPRKSAISFIIFVSVFFGYLWIWLTNTISDRLVSEPLDDMIYAIFMMASAVAVPAYALVVGAIMTTMDLEFPYRPNIRG